MTCSIELLNLASTTSSPILSDTSCNRLGGFGNELQQSSWLQQYVALREHCFKTELGISGFQGDLDHFDQTGYILLVIADGSCIGGARLNDNGEKGDQRLPLETHRFDLPLAFPELTIPGTRYGQWTRLVLHPDFRSPTVLNHLSAAMAALAESLGLHYCFNVSGTQRSRLYRKLHQSQGFRYELRSEVRLPMPAEFEHLEHLLAIAYGKEVTESLAYQPEADRLDECQNTLNFSEAANTALYAVA